MTDQLGTITMETIQDSGKSSRWSAKLDALACEDAPYGGGFSWLLILSCVGPQTSIKAMSAILQSKRQFHIWSKLPNGDRGGNHIRAGQYAIKKHRLGFDQWQMLAIADRPGLIANLSPAAVWHELSSSRFTTPLLRDWMPVVGKDLVAKGRLKKLTCFRCDAAVLYCTSAMLDETVSAAVKRGDVAFT